MRMTTSDRTLALVRIRVGVRVLSTEGGTNVLPHLFALSLNPHPSIATFVWPPKTRPPPTQKQSKPPAPNPKGQPAPQ